MLVSGTLTWTSPAWGLPAGIVGLLQREWRVITTGRAPCLRAFGRGDSLRGALRLEQDRDEAARDARFEDRAEDDVRRGLRDALAAPVRRREIARRDGRSGLDEHTPGEAHIDRDARDAFADQYAERALARAGQAHGLVRGGLDEAVLESIQRCRGDAADALDIFINRRHRCWFLLGSGGGGYLPLGLARRPTGPPVG